MNEHFVNIKVDREERPDVDQLYMTAVQVLTRHGGWPMSVFLTPDLKPFFGGTYFPPEDRTAGRASRAAARASPTRIAIVATRSRQSARSPVICRRTVGALRGTARKGPFFIITLGRVAHAARAPAAAELHAINRRIFPLWRRPTRTNGRRGVWWI